MHNLNWLDYGIIVLIAFSTLISLVRGFIREAISLASWIIAFWVALTFSHQAESYIQNYVHSASLRYGIAFFVLFVGVLLIGALVNFIITQFVQKTGLSGTDRVLGMVFGFGRGVLLVAVFMLAAQLTALPQTSYWQQSKLLPSFAPIEVWLASYIPKGLISSKKSKPLTNSTSDEKMMKEQKPTHKQEVQ